MSTPDTTAGDKSSAEIAAAWELASASTPPSSAEPSKFRQIAIRYGISLASLAIPAIVTLALAAHPRFSPVISLSYVLTVCTAAWWGGVIPGILVSCATIPVLTLAATKGRSIIPPHLDPVGLVLLIFISFLVASVAKNRKRIEQVLRAANEQLEIRVSERTAELQQANLVIHHRLAELESLYRELPVGICFIDNRLRFLRINEKLAAINGVPISTHIGREMREIIPGPMADILEPLYRRVFETGKPILDFEMSYPTMRDSSGQRTWVLNIAPVLAGNGAILGTQCIVQDITERKQSERDLSQANENLRRVNGDLQQFAFSASHDLQEPLRTVAIYSQLLDKRYGWRLDPSGRVFLEYLTTAAKRMASLVHDLLTYTQTANADEPDGEIADSSNALRCALESLSAAANESGAQITHDDALPPVRMRNVHLQQIFQNLVGNAIKYRGATPPRIHVSAREQDTHWIFSVKDNGIGIDPAYKERVFGIFKRLHTADQYSGTGIGLAICKRIVERYGGRIWVESAPGKGATFFFTVPV